MFIFSFHFGIILFGMYSYTSNWLLRCIRLFKMSNMLKAAWTCFCRPKAPLSDAHRVMTLFTDDVACNFRRPCFQKSGENGGQRTHENGNDDERQEITMKLGQEILIDTRQEIATVVWRFISGIVIKST